MAVVVCPWCQSEIPQEEGEEPEKYCPVCENELDGYRTLRIGLDDEDEEEEDEAESDGLAPNGEEDLSWADDGELTEKNEALLQFEEAVESLLDEQDMVPECPLCREYMLAAGEQTVPAESFRARSTESLGGAVLGAPFALTVYVCPSCFAVQHTLAEEARGDLARRLTGRTGPRR